MATKLVTEEIVFNACRELTAEGEKPSTVKIFKKIKMGSNTTIGKYLKAWEQSQEAADVSSNLPAKVELPEAFEEQSQSFLKKVYQLAHEEMAKRVEQIQADRDQAVEAAEQETAEAVNMADAIAAELSDAQAIIAEKEDTEKAQAARIAKLEAESEHKTKEFNKQFDAIKELNKKLESQSLKIGEYEARAKAAEDVVKAKEKEIERAQDQIKQAHEYAKADIKEARSSFEDELKRVREESKTKALEAAEAHKKDKEEHAAELKELHAQQIAEIKALYDRQIEGLKESAKLADAEIKTLTEKVEQQVTSLIDTTQELVNTKQALDEANAELKSLKESEEGESE